MAQAGRMTVTGERDVIRALARVKAEAADMRTAHVRVAELLTPIVAQRSRRRSGALASSWTPGGEPGAARIRSTVAHAAPMEFGWPARGIPPTAAVVGAFRDNVEDVEAIYADELRAIGARAGLA